MAHTSEACMSHAYALQGRYALPVFNRTKWHLLKSRIACEAQLLDEVVSRAGWQLMPILCQTQKSEALEYLHVSAGFSTTESQTAGAFGVRASIWHILDTAYLPAGQKQGSFLHG